MVAKDDSKAAVKKTPKPETVKEPEKEAPQAPLPTPRPAVLATVVEVDQGKTGVSRYPYEVWFSLRKKKTTAFRAMRIFATKRSQTMLHTLEEWDQLFSRF